MTEQTQQYDVNTYPLLDEETAQGIVQLQHDLLPDEARLGLLSFTGSRAFGWGSERHDIDVHGFYEYPGWYRQCHSDIDGIDMTVRNLESFEDPRWEEQRFKRYYDLSQLIWIHPELEDAYGAYRDGIEPSTVLNVYPYDMSVQLGRLEAAFNTRSALHSYKELLIPLHFLRTGEVYSDVVNYINQKDAYQYEWLERCADKYRDRDGSIDIDEDAVWDELDDIWERLTEQVMDKTDWEPDDEEEERWS